MFDCRAEHGPCEQLFVANQNRSPLAADIDCARREEVGYKGSLRTERVPHSAWNRFARADEHSFWGVVEGWRPERVRCFSPVANRAFRENEKAGLRLYDDA